MIKDLNFGGSFCVLPWIEKFHYFNGHTKLCCWSEKFLESEQQAELIRNEIWNRKPVSHCETCYKLEQDKTISPRQRESVAWLKDDTVKNLFNTNLCPQKSTLFLDLRLENKCNLACISCNPKDSSLWAKELNIEIIKSKISINYNDFSTLKKIYICGGEPFLIKEYYDIIRFVAEKHPNIEIVVNTNLTVLPDDLINSIKKINKFTLVVSIDAFGSVNEYHRYPLKWSKFIHNLERVKELGITVQFNTVVDAISIFGLGQLSTMDHIPDYWTLTILEKPDWLLLENIPVHLKEEANNQLIEFFTNNFYKTDVVFKTVIELIKKQIMQSGDSSLLIEQIKNIDSRRKINHKDYLGFNLF